MTVLKRRVDRLDAAAGPHLGQRLAAALNAALSALSDEELERYAELLELPPGAERDALESRSDELADATAAGSAAWIRDLFNGQELPDFEASRVVWARVPFTPPPPGPAGGGVDMLRAARALPAGPERDAHLVAAVALALMFHLRDSTPA